VGLSVAGEGLLVQRRNEYSPGQGCSSASLVRPLLLHEQLDAPLSRSLVENWPGRRVSLSSSLSVLWTRPGSCVRWRLAGRRGPICGEKKSAIQPLVEGLQKTRRPRKSRVSYSRPEPPWRGHHKAPVERYCNRSHRQLHLHWCPGTHQTHQHTVVVIVIRERLSVNKIIHHHYVDSSRVKRRRTKGAFPLLIRTRATLSPH